MGRCGQKTERYEQNGNISSHSHAWSAITGKPSTFPPSSHTHDARYYTSEQINGFFGVVGNADLLIDFRRLSSSQQTFPLTAPWTGYRYVYVGLRCNGYKSGMFIPTTLLDGAPNNHVVSCIYNLTQYFVNALVTFSADGKNVTAFIAAHGSDVAFSAADLFVYGLMDKDFTPKDN